MKGGGIDNMFRGVNMCEAQIYIKKTLKNRQNYTLSGVDVVSQLRGLGGVKVSLPLPEDIPLLKISPS